MYHCAMLFLPWTDDECSHVLEQKHGADHEDSGHPNIFPVISTKPSYRIHQKLWIIRKSTLVQAVRCGTWEQSLAELITVPSRRRHTITIEFVWYKVRHLEILPGIIF